MKKRLRAMSSKLFYFKNGKCTESSTSSFNAEERAIKNNKSQPNTLAIHTARQNEQYNLNFFYTIKFIKF